MIEYPYLPSSRGILYVPENHACMYVAKIISRGSGCVKQPTGAVVVSGVEIIGMGTNAGKRVEECPRWGSPTGENYGPCRSVCMQEGHAEVMAIRNALSLGHEVTGTDLYLYGHWWCCEDCWRKIISAGIKRVFLMENSWELFNPDINTAMKSWGKPK
jgi:deoxycytidylate deaminase